MASRNTRALIARQTLDIIDCGEYRIADQDAVSIADAVERATTGTIHYTPQDFARVYEQRDMILSDMATEDCTQFRVINATTLAAARELLHSDQFEEVLCLNIASAKNPGGGFLGGSQAQEESLARATALYPCINAKQGYYETNRKCRTCLYTDHMIYSPAIPVFRDDDDQLLATPYNVSIITAPAVNTGALRRNEPEKVAKVADVMLGRIEKVLSLAVCHGHRTLVLGAWGCGVFGNDPASVAKWFHQQLCESDTFRGAFDTVVFAVLDRTKDLGTISSSERRFSAHN